MNITDLPADSKGIPFSKPTFFLPMREYTKIVSEINNLYKARYKGKRICTHISFGIDGNSYIYWFENHGFNEYNIYLRVFDMH
ncbi:MAG: hypothetical protein K6G88_11200 [Lachnospiraceae bacterium]|nr:hypothetical protein [Lachnospiraceae bacterium]